MLTRQESLLLNRLEEEIQKSLEGLAVGAAPEYAATKWAESCGRIQGLRDAITLLEEINSEISKGG